MKRLIVLMFLIDGCIPIPLHQREISALSYKINVLTREMERCEKQNLKLIEALKYKVTSTNTTTTIIEKKEQIKPEELDEIKRQALEDTERKFKIKK